MHDDKKPKLYTESQQDKAIFICGVFFVGDQTSVFIKKSSLRFFESDAMLPQVL